MHSCRCVFAPAASWHVALVELFRHVSVPTPWHMAFIGVLSTSVEREVVLFLQHAHAQQLVELAC